MVTPGKTQTIVIGNHSLSQVTFNDRNLEFTNYMRNLVSIFTVSYTVVTNFKKPVENCLYQRALYVDYAIFQQLLRLR